MRGVTTIHRTLREGDLGFYPVRVTCCPECATYDAYIGLLWVHCRNPQCRYYDKRYDERRTREELGDLLPEMPPPPESPSDRLKRVRDLWYPKP